MSPVEVAPHDSRWRSSGSVRVWAGPHRAIAHSPTHPVPTGQVYILFCGPARIDHLSPTTLPVPPGLYLLVLAPSFQAPVAVYIGEANHEKLVTLYTCVQFKLRPGYDLT